MASDASDTAPAPFRPYSWRQAFMKADIPALSKLVLHTIAAHFGEAGEPAYPRVVTIARRASLTDRAVKKHLQGLKGVWIHVERLNVKGERGTRYHYLPRYPDALIAFEPDSHSGEPRSREPRSPAQNKEPRSNNKTSPYPNSQNPSELGAWLETAFFKLYPNQAAKPRALKTLARLNPDAAMRASILAGLARWLKQRDSKPVPLASTWLRQQRWREALERPIPWTCKACGAPTSIGDGRDFWCRAHDPMLAH